MKTENAIDNLTRDILLLEQRRNIEFKALKEELHTTYESLKPINLIKSTIENVTHSPDLKEGLGKATIGVVSGFLIKNLLFRSSSNPLKKIAGVAVQAIVTNLAAKNSDKIKKSGESIFKGIMSFISSRTKKSTEDVQADF